MGQELGEETSIDYRTVLLVYYGIEGDELVTVER